MDGKVVDSPMVFEDDEGFTGISGKPTDYSGLLMFQIGRINMAGSSEGLIYDKIKASIYNNAVEELEALLENYIEEDRYYYDDLRKRRDAELKSLEDEGVVLDSLTIVRLSRVKSKCLYAVMGRHGLFPARTIIDEM